MNGKRTVAFMAAILPFLLIGGLIFLVVKSLISAKATEKKPEIEPTDAGTENNRKAAVFPVVSESFSVQPVPEIPLPVILMDVIPATMDKTQFPPRHKRKRITRENMAAIFRQGSRKLNLPTAVAELKTLGFGHSAAYEALKPNGQFSAWLRFAPDGIITWTDH